MLAHVLELSDLMLLLPVVSLYREGEMRAAFAEGEVSTSLLGTFVLVSRKAKAAGRHILDSTQSVHRDRRRVTCVACRISPSFVAPSTAERWCGTLLAQAHK
jgi:hypothetical protein